MDAAAIADRYAFANTLIADAGSLSLCYFRDQAGLEIASKGLQAMASQAERIFRVGLRTKWVARHDTPPIGGRALD